MRMGTPVILHTIVAALLLCAVSEPAAAQSCASYDASLGTPPGEQGWNHSFTDPMTAEVVGGVLHASTLPFCNNDGCDGTYSEQQYSFWAVPSTLSFDDDPVFEARLRILSCEYIENPCSGWARPGFAMAIESVEGRSFWVGLGSSTIFLANDEYVPLSDPGVVEDAFDTTDGFHTYRLAISGSSAALLVDGDERLSLSSVGGVHGSVHQVWIGDGTSWANAEAEIEWFHVTASVCCEADFDGSGDVGVADFLALLAAWGNCPDPPAGCPTDLDRNGTVNVNDFLLGDARSAQSLQVGQPESIARSPGIESSGETAWAECGAPIPVTAISI
jgi:hypothetical protein